MQQRTPLPGYPSGQQVPKDPNSIHHRLYNYQPTVSTGEINKPTKDRSSRSHNNPEKPNNRKRNRNRQNLDIGVRGPASVTGEIRDAVQCQSSVNVVWFYRIFKILT